MVTRFFDIDSANDALVEVAPLLETLAAQRAELIRLRDRALTSHGTARSTTGDADVDVEEARRLRLRMQGVIDQMSAAVARIDEIGISLRDIERGLIDFPALVTGRQVWLCWQIGEADIRYWHELDAGFGGRRPITQLT